MLLRDGRGSLYFLFIWGFSVEFPNSSVYSIILLQKKIIQVGFQGHDLEVYPYMVNFMHCTLLPFLTHEKSA